MSICYGRISLNITRLQRKMLMIKSTRRCGLLLAGFILPTGWDAMAKWESFITLKDHKDSFESNLLCRLQE